MSANSLNFELANSIGSYFETNLDGSGIDGEQSYNVHPLEFGVWGDILSNGSFLFKHLMPLYLMIFSEFSAKILGLFSNLKTKYYDLLKKQKEYKLCI